MERHLKDEATFNTEASIVVTFLKREPRMQCVGNDNFPRKNSCAVTGEAIGKKLLHCSRDVYSD